MKVNVKIDISDEERRNLADYIDGHTSQRIATRKMVNAFVQGCLDRAIGDELPSIDTLRDRFDESYVRGWIQVGDRICNKK